MRHEVFRFAAEMERTLATHDDRAGWSDETPKWLLTRLIEETVELGQSLAQGESNAVILRRTTNVANFAMMIADVTYGLGPEAAHRRSGG